MQMCKEKKNIDIHKRMQTNKIGHRKEIKKR